MQYKCFLTVFAALKAISYTEMVAWEVKELCHEIIMPRVVCTDLSLSA